MLMKYVVVATLFWSIHLLSYTLDLQSNCLSYNANNVCTSWNNTGFLNSDEPSCFPQHMLVKTPTGMRAFKDLRVGDKLLGRKDELETYHLVKGWLHRQEHIIGSYVNILVANQSIVVSSKHNIALDNGNYVFAEDSEDKILFEQNQKNKEIIKSISNGKYAPLTEFNNYFVYSSESVRLLAHDFAHVRNPQNYQFVVRGIFNLWNIAFEAKEQTHPLAPILYSICNFLVE